MAQLTWLITATTSGLGVALFEHLVSRGGRIIATGRGAERRLAHLKSDNVAVLDLDVTSSQSTIGAQVKKPWDIWGGIDVNE